MKTKAMILSLKDNYLHHGSWFLLSSLFWSALLFCGVDARIKSMKKSLKLLPFVLSVISFCEG